MKPLFLLLLCIPALAQSPKPWLAVLQERLPAYGHRNWIVVADSAYPLQSAPGIETVVANGDPIDVLRRVLDSVAQSKHVRPVIYTDAELKSVPEPDAIGIGAFRQLLDGLFSKFYPGQPIQSIPHEQIIHKLDEASKTFNVLIIKTPGVLPYTSVFLELRAAYWSDEAEQRLRQIAP
jgi:hypothetical protein